MAKMDTIGARLVEAFDTRLRKSRRYMMSYETVDGGTVTLDPTKDVYKATATGGVFPTVVLTGLPDIHSYFCFELEVSVPSGATLNTTAVSEWTWVQGFELPTAGYAGKTIYVSARADCHNGGVTASCWRVV